MSPRRPAPAVPEPTPEGIAAWVAAMPPGERMRMAAVIADKRTASLMTRIRQETAYAETRTRTHAEASAELGVSRKRLAELIADHNRRVEPHSA